MKTRMTGFAAALAGSFIGAASANEFPLAQTQSPLVIPGGPLALPDVSSLLPAPMPTVKATVAAPVPNSPEARIVTVEPKATSHEQLLALTPKVADIIKGTALTFFTVNDPNETDFLERNKLVIQDDWTGTICINEESAQKDVKTTCYRAEDMPVPDITKAVSINFIEPERMKQDGYGDGLNKMEIVSPGHETMKGYLGLHFAYTWDFDKSEVCVSMGQEAPQAAVTDMGCAPLRVGQYVNHFILPTLPSDGPTL